MLRLAITGSSGVTGSGYGEMDDGSTVKISVGETSGGITWQALSSHGGLNKMKQILLILGLSYVLAGCQSELDPKVYGPKRAFYKKIMLNGEVIATYDNYSHVKYEGSLYSCYTFTRFCVED